MEVVTDGRFQEWDRVPTLLVDPADVPETSAVDLGAVQAAADGRHLFFTLETRREVNAQAMRGTISILLDTDADPETGTTVEGFPGVDLVVELSREDRIDPDGYGSGMALREAMPEGALGERANGSLRDLLVAPTHSADRFEIRLGRMEEGGGGRSDLEGPAAGVAFIFKAEGVVVDRTEPAVLRLPRLNPGPPGRWFESFDPRGDLRVVVWNVSSENFRDQPERFARILGALEPDVLLLDEVYGAVTELELQLFFARPEFGSGRPWEFVLGKSGGRQKTVVASRIGIRPESAMELLPYPDGALEALANRFPEARRLFDLERDRGLASVGAWIDFQGRPILFVPIDLQSAGYDGSFQDELRILQARTLREFVAEALRESDSGPALVIGGDLNLVGSRTPLDLLVSGLDGEGDLIPVDSYRLTDRSMATWRNDDQPFSPGRLDFVLISGSTLSVDRAFPFEAEEISADLLVALGVHQEDSRRTSDHLPLVVDLSIVEVPERLPPIGRTSRDPAESAGPKSVTHR
jgi:hypothetical protein